MAAPLEATDTLAPTPPSLRCRSRVCWHAIPRRFPIRGVLPPSPPHAARPSHARCASPPAAARSVSTAAAACAPPLTPANQGISAACRGRPPPWGTPVFSGYVRTCAGTHTPAPAPLCDGWPRTAGQGVSVAGAGAAAFPRPRALAGWLTFADLHLGRVRVCAGAHGSPAGGNSARARAPTRMPGSPTARRSS